MSRRALVRISPEGLYCPLGDFWIDPWKPVPTAVLTHAHSDHARSGSAIYHAAQGSRLLLQKRLGAAVPLVVHAYGETFDLGEVRVSLHPAGHILGSAQVRIESEGEVWVVTGDYKRQQDGTCKAFEPVSCDVLITEATFGLPIYQWPETSDVAADIFHWWQSNRALGRNVLLACYALGKAQRLLHALQEWTDQPVLTHGATEILVEAYREEGVSLLPTIRVGEGKKNYQGELILAPPSALSSPWAKKFGDAEVGFASGWMQIRGNRRRRGYDRGFVLSDHADWDGLLRSIRESGARTVYATHGYSHELARHLRDLGYDAEPLSTLFEGEADT